jgi:addiction module HigA family antidote
MAKKRLKPIHPGEVLLKEFLEPFNLSQNRLALAIKVPPRRINEIVLGKRGVSADTALRMAFYFGNSPEFWLGLQMDYDLDVLKLSKEKVIQKEVEPQAEAA